MGFRTTTVLLAVVGLLVLLLVVTDRGPDEPVSVTEPVLDGRRVSEATRIVIERRDTQAVVLEPRGDHFEIVEPVQDVASLAILQSIAVAYDSARRLVAYSAEEVGAEPRLWAETGLETPRMRIRFEFPEGDQVVNLGEVGPLGQDLFLGMGSGDVIYRAGLDLFTVLDVTPEDMRERLVFRHAPAQVQGITVERVLPGGSTETLELQRSGSEFKMVQPRVGRVDHINLPVFLASVLGLRVEDFVPGVMRVPPGPPDVAVTVRGNGSERVTLWFRQDGSMLGTMESRGVSFRVSATEAESFFETAVENLRAHMLVSIEMQQVLRIELDPGDGSRAATLRRTGDGFRLAQPVDSSTNPTEVNRILQGLGNLGVVEFVEGEFSDPAFGLNSGFFTVTVVGQFEPLPIHVRLGRDDGVLTYARRDDEAQVVKIYREVADLLRQPWPKLLAKQVQRVSVPVGELRLQQDDGREIGFFRDGGEWRARGADAPLPWLKDFMEELVDLRADAVLDPESTELDVAPYRLQLMRSNGDVLAELQIYDRGDGGPLLVHNGRIDVLFQLSARVSRDLRELAK